MLHKAAALLPKAAALLAAGPVVYKDGIAPPSGLTSIGPQQAANTGSTSSSSHNMAPVPAMVSARTKMLLCDTRKNYASRSLAVAEKQALVPQPHLPQHHPFVESTALSGELERAVAKMKHASFKDSNSASRFQEFLAGERDPAPLRGKQDELLLWHGTGSVALSEAFERYNGFLLPVGFLPDESIRTGEYLGESTGASRGEKYSGRKSVDDLNRIRNSAALSVVESEDVGTALQYAMGSYWGSTEESRQARSENHGIGCVVAGDVVESPQFTDWDRMLRLGYETHGFAGAPEVGEQAVRTALRIRFVFALPPKWRGIWIRGTEGPQELEAVRRQLEDELERSFEKARNRRGGKPGRKIYVLSADDLKAFEKERRKFGKPRWNDADPLSMNEIAWLQERAREQEVRAITAPFS